MSHWHGITHNSAYPFMSKRKALQLTLYKRQPNPNLHLLRYSALLYPDLSFPTSSTLTWLVVLNPLKQTSKLSYATMVAHPAYTTINPPSGAGSAVVDQ